MGFMDFFVDGDPIKSKVDTCIALFERNDIPSLQQSLFELYQEFNRAGGGAKIINFEQKDRLCECFINMLNYDWMHDSDIREVWAEDGFYCIATYLNNDAKTMQDIFAGSLDLFLLIHAGERHLYPKFNDVLRKVKMKVAMMGPMAGPEAEIFTNEDFEGGAPYVLRQFKFFAATWISKVERQHPEIISSALRPAFERAKTDYEFMSIPPDAQLAKMNFFAKIIGSILEDM